MRQLEDFLAHGGKIIFYGPARGKAIERLLGLAEVPGLEGELEFPGGKCCHNALYSGGPLDRASQDPCNRIEAFYRRGKEERPALLFRSLPEWNGGCAAWIRGTNSFTMTKHCYQPSPLDAVRHQFPEKLFLKAMETFQWIFRFENPPFAAKEPIQTLRFHNNALYLASYGRTTTGKQWLSFPDGAPLFTGTDTILEDGFTGYNLVRAANLECRIFVRGTNGPLFCREVGENYTCIHRRLLIGELNHTQVIFRPEREFASGVHFGTDAACGFPLTCPPAYRPALQEDAFGPFYRLEDISGQLLISW